MKWVPVKTKCLMKWVPVKIKCLRCGNVLILQPEICTLGFIIDKTEEAQKHSSCQQDMLR